MIDRLLGIIAPHYCSGCGKTGTLLCDNCKYDIIQEPLETCIVCQCLTGTDNLCRRCKVPYQKAWCVGERSDSLQRLIGVYKFRRAKAGYCDIAELLLSRLPELPPSTIIVPIPTVGSHIRERGYDHMALIARYIAKKRGLVTQNVLVRKTNTKQRDASFRVRQQQAKQAFGCRGLLEPDVPYVLIDDVVTTGATLYYSAQALRDGGANIIWVAAVARQPLD